MADSATCPEPRLPRFTAYIGDLTGTPERTLRVELELAAAAEKYPKTVGREKTRLGMKLALRRQQVKEQLRRAKPPPAGEAWKVICGDCVEELVSLPEQPALIFADPPYGIGIEEWDQFETYNDLHEFNVAWLTACRLVLAKRASLWISGTRHNIYSIGHALREQGFDIMASVVWEKPFVQKRSSPDRLIDDHELLIWAAIGNPRTYSTELARAVWRIKPSRPHAHPTEKPLALIEKIIRLCSKPGDLVVDPFCGSGTTLEAAVKLKRRTIGIETDNHWAEVARSRVANAER